MQGKSQFTHLHGKPQCEIMVSSAISIFLPALPPPRCKHMKIPLVLGSLELLNLLSIFAVKPDFKFLLDPCIQP